MIIHLFFGNLFVQGTVRPNSTMLCKLIEARNDTDCPECRAMIIVSDCHFVVLTGIVCAVHIFCPWLFQLK